MEESRLAPLTLFDEDDFEDGGVGHVSYTVASSVLDERGELHPVALVVGPPALELPPIPPANLSTVPLPATASEGTVTVIGDIALTTGGRPRASSIPLVQLTNVVTARPTTLISSEAPPSATVQADCSTMQVKDAISQPLPTPAIQRSQVVAPLHVCAVPVTFDTGVVGERIGTVLRPVTLTHPQDMVSNSLDKIVDVKERLNEAEGASSTAVSQQLLVELRIAEREMDLLDPRTQLHEEVEAFYVELEKFYKEDHTFYKVIVGDFDAKIRPRRSAEELHIGTHGLEWNEQEASLRWTWECPGGQFHNEIDHIIFNRKYCLADVSVVPKFYTGSDHRLLRARFRFSRQGEKACQENTRTPTNALVGLLRESPERPL
ncbi:unnamed protein product [Heligmosomoides polygyrus]|uniref:Endo/exonuclease/phosphatase domain-containing protein n=1 Tax=Heligmosomoides polygyrus TaxID=6339 RepID=A0A3P7ZP77_HELPZ|nr:unnamed protein product [Heligmosomoides polygyrus]